MSGVLSAGALLAAWELPAGCVLQPIEQGLINQTFRMDVPGTSIPLGVLQRLNTEIFDARVHEDIEAVTAHLASKGLRTPRLMRTREDALWHTDGEGGVWRVLTWEGRSSIDKLTDRAQAESAGALVARFHHAVRDLQWAFRSVRPGAHNTEGHLTGLAKAVEVHSEHRLHSDVALLSETIAQGWRTWEGPRALPKRVVHGDLKISNVRFENGEAVALVDLDTLAMGSLDIELGDALRSWCNPLAEDTRDARFDLALFRATMRGYARVAEPLGSLTEDEWRAIVPGVERIAWELAARFARDALEERYFGWSERFGTRGAHNLLRARGQAALAISVRAQRRMAEADLRSARTRA